MSSMKERVIKREVVGSDKMLETFSLICHQGVHLKEIRLEVPGQRA